MKRRFRLTKSSDFKRVRRFGKSFAHPLIVLVAIQNEMEQTRIAVAAGRSVGKAVQRNRAKRLLRAALQPLIPSIKPGWDLLLIGRSPLASAKYQETHTALVTLLNRAELLQQPDAD